MSGSRDSEPELAPEADGDDMPEHGSFISRLLLRLRAMPATARLLVVVGLDASVIAATLWLVGGSQLAGRVTAFPHGIMAVAGFTSVAVLVFLLLRLYQRSWRYLAFEDCVSLVATVLAGVSIAWLTRLFASPATFNDAELLLPTMLSHILLVGSGMAFMRILRRAVREELRKRRKASAGALQARQTAILVGELDWARAIIELARADPACAFEVAAILTETPHIGRLNIAGVPVMGTPGRLKTVARLLERGGTRLQAVIVRDNFESAQGELSRLLPAANDLGLTINRIRNVWERRDEERGALQLEQLPLSDLLGRAPIERSIAGRRVLVTGAGGTIGGELVRQIASFGPVEIILLDHAEYNLYAIDMEVRELFPAVRFQAELCSIRQAAALREVFARRRPELVFHAAALKHVPIVERNPCDGIHTNVIGTQNVANAVCEFGARAMIQVSTDKAVNPVGMMGTTKRLGELYCQALDLIGATDPDSPRFMTVRFGNVLGSSGSLIPLFKKQIAAGKPLTVTHPDIERFFMTVHEAVQLILQSSARTMESRGSRGAIFVLDMGSPVKIVDVAKRMLRLAGLPSDDDVIKFVGLRPGEKLYEELFDASEERVPSNIPGVFEARPCPLPLDQLVAGFAQLHARIQAGDDEGVCAVARRLIEAPKQLGWDPALLRTIQEMADGSFAQPQADPPAACAL